MAENDLANGETVLEVLLIGLGININDKVCTIPSVSIFL